MKSKDLRLIVGGALSAVALGCYTWMWLSDAEAAQSLLSSVGGYVSAAVAVIGPSLVALLRRDSDGDGTPDLWDDTPKGPPLLALGLAVALAAPSMVGCAGAPREMRIATAATAEAVEQADRMLAERIRVRGVELRADIVSMHGAGVLESAADAMAYYDAEIEDEMAAIAVLETAAASLRAVEAAADAWDAGTDGAERGFLRAVACAIPAVREIPVVLVAVGVDVPSGVTQWIDLAAGYAAGMCGDDNG